MKNKEKIQLLENRLNIQSKILEKIITKLEVDDNEAQPKKLDQSVFIGLDSKWKYAAVDANGSANVFNVRVHPRGDDKYGLFAYADNYANSDDNSIHLGEGYDTSNWKKSLIERDTVKELTGSELCKAMLARGDTRIMCLVTDDGSRDDITHVIRVYEDGRFHTKANSWKYAVPINNQGDPLTSSDVSL